MSKERLCWSRGPRIGWDGVPYCKLPEDHEGLHRPAPDDGWGENMVWGEPDMRESWRNERDLPV